MAPTSCSLTATRSWFEAHTDSILPSITRRSLVQVAEDLGMTVDNRPVEWAEVKSGKFSECGMCGTAAVISPVGEIDNRSMAPTRPSSSRPARSSAARS